jgi:ADP-heptose:LPS heptosyltransferase
MNWAHGLLKDRGYGDRENIFIAMHPGSGGKKKCWPWENYEALIRMITGDHRTICILLSGPAEDKETVQALSRLEQGNRRIMHLHHEPLIQIAALLTLSDYYVGNDSGISHLAGVMRCRGLVLFGPTDPRLWRPRGGTMDVLIFEGEGISDMLSAGQVYARVKSALSLNAR